jgi:hypothetical protein
VLLAETLRSSTLKLALISIGIFGAVVIALFSYVYWSTASYVRSRADRGIVAEQAISRESTSGPDGARWLPRSRTASPTNVSKAPSSRSPTPLSPLSPAVGLEERQTWHSSSIGSLSNNTDCGAQ